jgi:putative DNA primase/helicase
MVGESNFDAISPGRPRRQAPAPHPSTPQTPTGPATAPSANSLRDNRSVLDEALALHRAGYCVLPIRRDGSKRPMVDWQDYEKDRPSEEQIKRWFDVPNPPGIGIVGGPVSGGAYCLDFDNHAVENFPLFSELVEAERPGLLKRCAVVRSPGTGERRHVWFRCPDGEPLPREVLASDPAAPGGEQTLIELRGEGGQTLAPGCPPECHPSGGEYKHIDGPALEQLRPLSADERAILLAYARSFNRKVTDCKTPPCKVDGGRPGDDYNRRGPDWKAILEPHGWLCVRQRGDVWFWRRPGKEGHGCSATTGFCKGKDGTERLYVFSSNAPPFEAGKMYSKLAVYTLLNHGGDFTAAARALADMAYGQADARKSKRRPKDTGEAVPVDRLGPGQVNETYDNPTRLARLFRAKHRHEAEEGLYYWSGDYWRWHGAAYQAIDEYDVKPMLARHVLEEFEGRNLGLLKKWRTAATAAAENDAEDTAEQQGPPPRVQRVTGKLVSDVALSLQAISHLPADFKAPGWLPDGEGPCPPGNVIAFPNGLLDLAAWKEGRPCLMPATPRFFTRNALDYSFCADAPTPTNWLKFLNDQWSEDSESIDTLHEMFGYMLTGDTSQQKMFTIVGPRRSGKGTIAKVLTRLIGPANQCALSFSDLSMPFGLEIAVGKTLAVIGEGKPGDKIDSTAAVARLLGITGEDDQTIHRKYKAPVTGKLPLRVLVLANQVPKFRDGSGALVGRNILFKHTKSFFGNEDTGLFDRLLPELPGILKLALAGWRRLRERGRFVQPKTGQDTVDLWVDLASPHLVFVNDCCVLGPNLLVPKETLFARWLSWCKAKGEKEPGTEEQFGAALLELPLGIKATRRRHRGLRVRFYEGLKLRTAADDVPQS